MFRRVLSTGRTKCVESHMYRHRGRAWRVSMGRQGRLFAAGLAAVMVALAGGSPVHAAPPMNDAFASATTIPATPVFGTESADNAEATREPGEPLHAGDVGGKSIWYTWAPTPAPPGAPPIIASIDTKGT